MARTTESLSKPDWNRRWSLIRVTLVWCAAVATYMIGWGPDDGLRQNAFVAIAGLSASVILGYCGFATWDDRNYLRAIGLRDNTQPTVSSQTTVILPEATPPES